MTEVKPSEIWKAEAKVWRHFGQLVIVQVQVVDVTKDLILAEDFELVVAQVLVRQIEFHHLEPVSHWQEVAVQTFLL